MKKFLAALLFVAAFCAPALTADKVRAYTTLEEVFAKEIFDAGRSEVGGSSRQLLFAPVYDAERYVSGVALTRSLIVNPGALLRGQMRVEIRRIIVMKKGLIAQIGTLYEIYLDPVSAFVVEFCGKVTFFHGRVNAIEADGCAVDVCGQTRPFPRWSKELKAGDEYAVMCRPESMGVPEPGAGFIHAVVNTNVYLGHSMETYLKGGRGAEILVQIDAPHTHRIYREGERRAVTISEEAAKVPP